MLKLHLFFFWTGILKSPMGAAASSSYKFTEGLGPASAMQDHCEVMTSVMTDVVSILLVLTIIERRALHKYMLDLLVIFVKH